MRSCWEAVAAVGSGLGGHGAELTYPRMRQAAAHAKWRRLLVFWFWLHSGAVLLLRDCLIIQPAEMLQESHRACWSQRKFNERVRMCALVRFRCCFQRSSFACKHLLVGLLAGHACFLLFLFPLPPFLDDQPAGLSGQLAQV